MFNNTPYNYTLSNFTTKTHYWNVTCQDAAGNTDTSSTNSFVIDTSEPIVSLVTPINNTFTSDSIVTFYYHVFEEDSSIANCSLIFNDSIILTRPGITITNNHTNGFISSVSTNDYEWKVQCVDTKGNIGVSPTTRLLVVDRTDPSVFTLVSPSNGLVSNNLNPTFVWQQTVDTNFANYSIQISDSASFSYVNQTIYTYEIDNVSLEVSLGTDTSWYWRVIAYDLLDNSRTSNSFSYITDTSAPVVTLIAPPNNDQDSDGDIDFFYSISESNVSECILYTNLTGIFEPNQTDSSPQNGLNVFSPPTINENTSFIWNVNCTDAFGYSSFYIENWSVIIGAASSFYQNITIPTNLSLYNSVPSIKNFVLDSEINLLAGTNTTVNCSFEIEDDNGVNDIQSFNATFYHSSVSSSSPDNYNNHYTSDCSCSNADSLTKNCSCGFDVRYYANNGTWTLNVSSSDYDGDVSDNISTTINDLRAVYLTPTFFSYGDLSVGETSSQDINVTIINFGNVLIDLGLFSYGSTINDGLAMLCENGNISSSYERFSQTWANPYASMTSISGNSLSRNIVDVNIGKKSNESFNSSVDLFWKISIPNTGAGLCNGSVVFSAESDS